jgi:small subunit ribosomal protein S2
MSSKLLTIKELFQHGVQQGYEANRWNPFMASYLFGIRNNFHVIDLEQSIIMLRRAINLIKEIASNRGTILFVGPSNNKHASNIITVAAKRCSQYYISHRWIGGTITNWKEIYNSIEKLKVYEERLALSDPLSPRELKKYKMLKSSLQGISGMNHLPDLLFLVSTHESEMILSEAKKYKIPVIAIVDSDSNPSDIVYPIPGNRNSVTSIFLYSSLISNAILEANDLEANKLFNLSDKSLIY